MALCLTSVNSAWQKCCSCVPLRDAGVSLASCLLFLVVSTPRWVLLTSGLAGSSPWGVQAAGLGGLRLFHSPLKSWRCPAWGQGRAHSSGQWRERAVGPPPQRGWAAPPHHPQAPHPALSLPDKSQCGEWEPNPKGNLFAGMRALPHPPEDQEGGPGQLVTGGGYRGRTSGDTTGRPCEWDGRLEATRKVQRPPGVARALRGGGAASLKP